MADWVARWRRLGPVLERERIEDIRRSTAAGIPAVIPTADLFRHLNVPLSPDSGLIEQQAWFAKLRHG
jgi:hypothetical protein